MNLLHTKRIVESRQIAGVAAFGDRLYGAPQHFPRAGLGKLSYEWTALGRPIGPSSSSTRAISSLSSRSLDSGEAVVAGSFKTANASGPALSPVRDTNDGDFGDSGVGTDRLFDFARPEPVASHVDDVIGPAEDEVVAIIITDAPIEGGIDEAAGETGEIRFAEAVVLSPNGRHTAGGQRWDDANYALLIRSEFFAGAELQQADVIAVSGERRAAEFGGVFSIPGAPVQTAQPVSVCQKWS